MKKHNNSNLITKRLGGGNHIAPSSSPLPSFNTNNNNNKQKKIWKMDKENRPSFNNNKKSVQIRSLLSTSTPHSQQQQQFVPISSKPLFQLHQSHHQRQGDWSQMAVVANNNGNITRRPLVANTIQGNLSSGPPGGRQQVLIKTKQSPQKSPNKSQTRQERVIDGRVASGSMSYRLTSLSLTTSAAVPQPFNYSQTGHHVPGDFLDDWDNPVDPRFDFHARQHHHHKTVVYQLRSSFKHQQPPSSFWQQQQQHHVDMMNANSRQSGIYCKSSNELQLAMVNKFRNNLTPSKLSDVVFSSI